MLLGVLLGALIVLLVVGIILMTGKCVAYRGQITQLAKEAFAAREACGRFVALEQERQRIKEQVNVILTEEQITTLANRISGRIKSIYDAEQAAALGKLD